MSKYYTYCQTCKKETEFSYGEETNWMCSECGACYSMEQLDVVENLGEGDEE